MGKIILKENTLRYLISKAIKNCLNEDRNREWVKNDLKNSFEGGVNRGTIQYDDYPYGDDEEESNGFRTRFGHHHDIHDNDITDTDEYDGGEEYSIPYETLRIDGKPTSAYSTDRLAHFNRELNRSLKRQEIQNMYDKYSNPSQRYNRHIPPGDSAMKILKNIDDDDFMDYIDYTTEPDCVDGHYANRVGDWTGDRGHSIM